MPDGTPTNPLDPATISGTKITLDFMMSDPKRVTRVVADLTMANFYLYDVFSSDGDVTGGAVLYDRPTAPDVYTTRDVERVDAGTEFPIISSDRTAPRIAVVEKFGGKFAITDEARKRNNISLFNNHTRRVANTIVRKMHQRGMAELQAAITEHSRTAAGNGWVSAMALTGTTSSPALRPARTFAAAQREAENNEMGYVYDTLIVNPTEAEALRVCYGSDLQTVLADNGITKMISTPRKTAGSCYLLSGGNVGGVALEEPMNTESGREAFPTNRQQTWFQTSVNPVMYVTDPYAIIEMTGIGA